MIQLRQVEKKDLTKIKEWRNSYIEFFRQTKLLNDIDQDNWIESLGTDETRQYKNIMFSVWEVSDYYPMSLLDNGSGLIGICGLTNIDWKNRNAEISFITEKYIDNRCTEIMDQLLKWCFENYNMHMAWVEIYSNDKPKEQFLNNYGFIETGYRMGTYFWKNKYHDSVYFCLTKKQWMELKECLI